jgi:lysosomal acid lipase/cholesteryl ester hydrolase
LKPQLIAKNGYPVETHHVITKDGYILQIHRIPHGRKNSEESNKPAVLLQHGLLASSADWIMNTVDKALGMKL